MVAIDCFKIDGYNTTEDSVDVRIASTAFLPQSIVLYFKRSNDKEMLEIFLDNLENKRRNLPYRDKLSFFFLNREFESLVDAKQPAAIRTDVVREYLKNLNVYESHTLDSVGEKCNEEEYFHLMNKILSEQDKNDDHLYKIFEKYSSEYDGEKYFFINNYTEFMKHHQKESLDNDQASRIIRTHLDQEKNHKPDQDAGFCWDYEEFTDYLCSDENSLINPVDDQVHHDMTQPLSKYWINSSHNTYLTGGQIDGTADLRAYEQVLRLGVRCVEIDVWSGSSAGGECMPLVYHGIGVPVSTTLKLDQVLRTINKYAFIRSEYPLIISIEDHCNAENQIVMARLFVETFGDKLVTKKLSQGETFLPSPEHLKHRIILKGYCSDHEESIAENAEKDPLFIDHIQMKKANCQWKEKELFLKGKDLMFESAENKLLLNAYKEPYFVGKTSSDRLNDYLEHVRGKTNGNFLVRLSEEKMLIIVIFYRKKFMNYPIKLENKMFKVDGKNEFHNLNELITYYQQNYFANGVVKLKSPFPMNWVHLNMQWFYGAMDKDLSGKMLMQRKKKGVFLVREFIENKLCYSIDYFDGNTVQQIEVSVDSEGKVLHTGIDLERRFRNLTEFVNYIHTFPLKHGTKLKGGLKLKGKVIVEENSFRRGESIKIRSIVGSLAFDQTNRSISVDSIDLSVDDKREVIENTISLEKCEILKKTDQCLELTTRKGEKFELSTEAKIEKLISILNYAKSNDEV